MDGGRYINLMVGLLLDPDSTPQEVHFARKAIKDMAILPKNRTSLLKTMAERIERLSLEPSNRVKIVDKKGHVYLLALLRNSESSPKVKEYAVRSLFRLTCEAKTNEKLVKAMIHIAMHGFLRDSTATPRAIENAVGIISILTCRPQYKTAILEVKGRIPMADVLRDSKSTPQAKVYSLRVLSAFAAEPDVTIKKENIDKLLKYGVISDLVKLSCDPKSTDEEVERALNIILSLSHPDKNKTELLASVINEIEKSDGIKAMMTVLNCPETTRNAKVSGLEVINICSCHPVKENRMKNNDIIMDEGGYLSMIDRIVSSKEEGLTMLSCTLLGNFSYKQEHKEMILKANGHIALYNYWKAEDTIFDGIVLAERAMKNFPELQDRVSIHKINGSYILVDNAKANNNDL
jgi:hypothetical protein